jgi:hypothetical protein
MTSNFNCLINKLYKKIHILRNYKNKFLISQLYYRNLDLKIFPKIIVLYLSIILIIVFNIIVQQINLKIDLFHLKIKQSTQIHI